MTTTDIVYIACALASTIIVCWLLDKLIKPGEYRELMRYSDDAMDQYSARRDARAEADPEFLTDYARRLAAWEQKKKNPSAA